MWKDEGIDNRKDAGTATEVRWRCQKHDRDLDEPECPDPELYCRHRTSCLVFNRHLLDD